MQFSDMKYPLITESVCDLILAKIIYLSSPLSVYPPLSKKESIHFLIPWGNASTTLYAMHT